MQPNLLNVSSVDRLGRSPDTLAAPTSKAEDNSTISPVPFFDAAFGYAKTAALRAAVQLEIFTKIAAGTHDVSALAGATGGAPRGIRILCDFLTVHGFLEKSEDRYSLPPSSGTFLDRRSPSYLGGLVDFTGDPQFVRLFIDDPTSFVRNGGSLGLGNIAPDHPVWIRFAAEMASSAAPIAETIARQAADWPEPPRKVLDIAAGHGIYGIAIAEAVPGAEIVAVDWHAVLSLAIRSAEAAGVAARYRTIAGSAFDVNWGDGYDLVLLPNFLHHFDKETCVALLKKVRASLSSKGRVWAVEFVPNEDRVSPPPSAAFAFVMLATTPRGDAYSSADFGAMAVASGFRGVTVSPLARPGAWSFFDAESLVNFER